MSVAPLNDSTAEVTAIGNGGPIDIWAIFRGVDSALVIAAQLQELAYKTPDDYDPFINVVAYYPLIAVRTESKYKTIQELLADASAPETPLDQQPDAPTLEAPAVDQPPEAAQMRPAADRTGFRALLCEGNLIIRGAVPIQ